MMRFQRPRLSRIAGLVLAGAIGMVLALFIGPDVDSKIKGAMLAAASIIFVTAEVMLWKLLDTLGALGRSPDATLREWMELGPRTLAAKRSVMERLGCLLFLRLLSASGGCLLLKTFTASTELWISIVATTAIAASIPITLSLVRSWRQTDKRLQQLQTEARIRKAKEAELAKLGVPQPIFRADDALVRYTEVAGTTNRKPSVSDASSHENLP